MSYIAGLSDQLRLTLVSVKDAVRQSFDGVNNHALSTVMGSGVCGAGSLKKPARKALVLAETTLVNAMNGVTNQDVLLDEIQKLLLKQQTQLAKSIHDAVLKELETFMTDGPRKQDVEAVKQLNGAFLQLRELTSEAIKNDFTMTTDRIAAMAEFDADVLMVETTMDTIKDMDSRIKAIQEELTKRYDPSNLLATANDDERERLAKLRSSTEEQRNFAERKMLEYFDSNAKTRSSDTKVCAEDLIIPENFNRGKGMELVTAMDTYSHGRTSQQFAIRPYLKRIPNDYNAETGTFWMPPTKENGYSDVSAKIRSQYDTQSMDLWNLFVRKFGVATMNSLTYSCKIGINKQIDCKCEEGDGVMAYYLLVSLNSPNGSSHRESILNKLELSHEHFKKGDPRNSVKNMKGFLSDAIKLQLRLKWSIGRKCINVLSGRHNIFAVRLQPLINTATNQDDAAAHIDKMLSEIVDCCTDIQVASGDHWFNQARADVAFAAEDRNKGRPQCRYGDKCKFKDQPGGCRFGHPTSQRPTGSTTLCQHKPCRQKPSGKDKKFCTTCFKKGLQDGSLPLKDGKSFNFKKASRTHAKKTKETGFNETQLKILSGMHVAATQDNEAIGNVFQAPSRGSRKWECSNIECLNQNWSGEESRLNRFHWGYTLTSK